MNIYERLIENPLFFKWIYHPTEEIESYWAQYLKMNPEEAHLINEFKAQFVKHLKYKDEKLTEIEKKALAKRIIRQLEIKGQRKKRSLVFRNTLRYAAVALIFFSIGSSLVYLYMESRQSTIIVENTTLPAYIQEPVLIIDDSKEIQLNQGNSELDYSKSGEIILNNEKIIQRETVNKAPEMNTLVIPYGSMSTITLADGSKVWLNAGSRLIYPSKFVDKTREVFLVGEAFFDIQRNEGQPFVIKTTDIEVKVLGTKFNVSAYPEDGSVLTILAEGSVEINRNNAGLFQRGTQLVPGQLASYNKNSENIRIYEVDIEHYTLWTQGLLNFVDTDLSRLVKKLERYYNIYFQYDNPLDGTIEISGKLDVTQEKEEVFEYLSKLTGLDFIRINDRRYEIK